MILCIRMLSMEVFMGKFVDFDEVKGRVSCEQAIAKLGLAMLRKGNQWRMACPTCKSDDPRSLCVTEGKGFYCWGGRTGGSVIDLAAHILGCTTNEAANFLVGTVDTVPGTVGTSTKGTVKGCSTVWRRTRILPGFRSSRACTVSRMASCSQRVTRRS